MNEFDEIIDDEIIDDEIIDDEIQVVVKISDD
jgi:hypothetical protein